MSDRRTYVLWGQMTYPGAVPIRITRGTWRQMIDEANAYRSRGTTALRISAEGAPYAEGFDPFAPARNPLRPKA